VADFAGEYGNNFLRSHLVNEYIVEHDVATFFQAREKGIRVGRPLATIHSKDLIDRKLCSLIKSEQAFPKFATG
jgi:hypothetical protein